MGFASSAFVVVLGILVAVVVHRSTADQTLKPGVSAIAGTSRTALRIAVVLVPIGLVIWLVFARPDTSSAAFIIAKVILAFLMVAVARQFRRR
jgi:CHASE1-domain containing sensor protein